MRRKLLVAGTSLALMFAALGGPALAADKLYVCGPCSRNFIEVAERVIAEMGLTEELSVKRTGCLGLCGNPAVIEFQDDVYTGMDEDKLRSLLNSVYSVKE